MQPREMAVVLGWMALVTGGAFLQACERDAGPTAPPRAPETKAAPPPSVASPAPAPPLAREATLGEPDGPKVRKWMQRRAREVRRCYESALAGNPNARGRLTLRFTISETGALRDVTTTRSTFARREVARCVEDMARGWVSPFRPEEPVEVEYPLSFSPR